MKRYILIIIAVLGLGPGGLAQEKLRGRVVDALDGRGLAGAVVRVKSPARTAVSGEGGYFELDLPKGSYGLQVRYLGYGDREVLVGLPQVGALVLELAADDNRLEEVQVIGYGQTTRRLNTGSVAGIGAREIERQPVTNVLSALSGRMPGVMVQANNGLPGGRISVQVRGRGSMAAGSEPLYIIDGVPFDGGAPNANNDMQSINDIAGAISPLNSLNPSDIASITVLKDADATAIYGSRGSNGVIIISTKRAAAGALQVDLNLRSGLSTISQRPRLLGLEEYLSIRRLAYRRLGAEPSDQPSSAYYAPDLTVWPQRQATDWIDHLYGGTAPNHNLQLGVKRGGANGSTSFGANYHSEGTITPGENRYERVGAFIGSEMSSSDNKFRMNLTSQFTGQHGDLSNLANTTAYLLPPNYPLYMPDGSYNVAAGSNPAAGIHARSKTNSFNLIGNLNLRYQFTPDLSLGLNTGHAHTTNRQVQLFPSRAILPTQLNHSDFGENTSASFIAEPQANYRLRLGMLTFDALLGATLQHRRAKREYLQFGNFRLEELMEDFASAGTVELRFNNDLQYRYASVFGRLTTSVGKDLVVNASLRRDGSSRFGPGNRFGSFGAVGIGWIFSQALGSARPKVLDHAKLRLSYGTTGNDQIGDYQFLSTYSSPGANAYQGVATMRPSRLNNQDFRWETTRKFNIGFDALFLGQRLALTADYYINRSADQLVSYALSTITGFGSYQANLPAVVQNSGLELSLSMQWTPRSKLTWETSLNLTLPKTVLKSFENLEQSAYAQRYVIGEDIARIYGARFLQMDGDGRPQYADRDGNYSTRPYLYHGLASGSPSAFGGLDNKLNFKNFEMGMLLQFSRQMARGGLTVYPGARAVNAFAIAGSHWSPEEPDALLPAPLANLNDGNFANSSLNIFDSSYLRAKNVYLSYQLGQEVAGKLGARNLRASLEATNLFTVWNRDIPLIDPESGGTVNSNARTFPTLRTVSLSLALGF